MQAPAPAEVISIAAAVFVDSGTEGVVVGLVFILGVKSGDGVGEVSLVGRGVVVIVGVGLDNWVLPAVSVTDVPSVVAVMVP